LHFPVGFGTHREISFSISGGGPHLHKLVGRASTGPYNTVSCWARVELKKQVFGRAVGLVSG
jgi:hypothetical protein